MQISEQKCSQIETPSVSVPIARTDSGFIVKSQLIFWAKIAVAVLTLALLIGAVKPGTLISVYKTARWSYLTAALFMIIPNILVQAWKWLYILRLANSTVSFATAFKSLLVGYPLGFITPGRLGEIGRAFYVKEISQGKTFRLFILDKLTNLLTTILFGSAGILFLFRTQLPTPLKACIFIILALTIVLFLHSIFFKSVIKVIGTFTKVHDFSQKNYFILLVFSVFFYFIFLTQFAFLVLNFDTVNLFSASKAAASVFLVKTMLPISFSDLGIREGAAVFFFGKISVSAAAALNASLLLFLFNVGIPAISGVPILLKTKCSL